MTARCSRTARIPTPPSHAGQIRGKTFIWAPVAAVPVLQAITDTVTGSGRAAGVHRIEVQVKTRDQQAPIKELESTTVY